jgi:hypothetical protein
LSLPTWKVSVYDGVYCHRMPKRTIYVREEDVSLWERADSFAAGNLSGLLATALKEFVARKEAEGQVGDHGLIAKRTVHVWGSHSRDGRYAVGTSFEADAVGSAHAGNLIATLQADPSIAHVAIEEERLFADGWVNRVPLEEWIRHPNGWRRASRPVDLLGTPYLVKVSAERQLMARNVGSGPAIAAVYVLWAEDSFRVTEFFHSMAGEEVPIVFSARTRMWPPQSIFKKPVGARGEAFVCSSSQGSIWRFLPLLPTSASGEATIDSSDTEWVTWYLNNVSAGA